MKANLLVIALVAVAALSFWPTGTQGSSNVAAVKQQGSATAEIWQEDDQEVLIRNERGAKNKDGQAATTTTTGGTAASGSCRYVKSSWSECDKTNQRSRTLTLKRGAEGCVQTRTIQKKCKKACRYEKGAWSECISGKMSRVDRLKAAGSPDLAAASCDPTRTVNKNCNPGKNNKNGEKNKENRQNKDKGGRKSRA